MAAIAQIADESRIAHCQTPEQGRRHAALLQKPVNTMD
jgi:hypothetical protein